MAKGSVRKKGDMYYYRYYVEDESGRKKQVERKGTPSKKETEALLRQAMTDYEANKRIAQAGNMTVGMLLDEWVKSELEPSKRSDGTVEAYKYAVRQIHAHPLGNRLLKTVTADHLQKYMDELSLGGIGADGKEHAPMPRGTLLKYSAVLHGAFKFAVLPKHHLTTNPMLLVTVHFQQDEEADIFGSEVNEAIDAPILNEKQYQALISFLREMNNPALLPVQIARYAGLRLGEVCALTWQDIDLDNQVMTIRRKVRYNADRRKLEIGTTKRKKVRTVYFGNTLADILRKAKAEQHKRRFEYGGLYRLNYYAKVVERSRTHYEYYSLPRSETPPADWSEIDFVCIRPDGAMESPKTVGAMCESASKRVPGLEGFHFHMLRHTFTSDLLEAGAKPLTVRDLLGHSSIDTTLKVYAHTTDEAKRKAGRLLDRPASNE